MTVIARDQVASDHLVYAWPLPIGPECEVSCSDDEQVVMCPAWMVGDRLGPGRHRWRTPDPSRPVGAFFVLTAPVEIGFDMVTSFVIPATGQPVRLRASGALQVRCADPGLLIAQFVGLPFDSVNEGVVRSVSRSVERMLARLLTRRVVMAGTPAAVTDPSMLAGIVEELVAYNPTAGAVFGVELIRMGHLGVAADDGSTPYLAMPQHANGNARARTAPPHADVPVRRITPPMGLTIKGMPAVTPDGSARPERAHAPTAKQRPITPALGVPVMTQQAVSGEIGGSKSAPTPSALAATSGEIIARKTTTPPGATSGEITQRSKNATVPGVPAGPGGSGGASPPSPPSSPPSPFPPAPPSIPSIASTTSGPRGARAVEVPSVDEITQPGVDSKTMTPIPGALRAPSAPASHPAESESRGSILGIGMAMIGHSEVAGEIPTKVPPGGRVLVPGPNGLMQSATVRQLLSGYYELEVGSSGQTIWVPINGVVPEP